MLLVANLPTKENKYSSFPIKVVFQKPPTKEAFELFKKKFTGYVLFIGIK
jgi:hypothetical protein